MKPPYNSLRIGIAVAVILGTIGWLAYTGYSSNKSYYVTIAELGGMGDKAYHSNLRVEGFVQPGSIVTKGTDVDFVLNEYESHSPKAPSGRLLNVSYKGTEPPPDTFKDDAQALAIGTLGRDDQGNGVFHANVLQAKCASKYAPAQPGTTPSTPAAPPASKPNTASASPSESPAYAPSPAGQTASGQTASSQTAN